MKKILYLLSFMILANLFTSCGKDDVTADDEQSGEDLQYSLKITNPIDNYEVALGSKVTLCIEPDEHMSYYDYDKHFYIDGQEINVTQLSEYDVWLAYNNYPFEWNVTGLTLGTHTLKVEMVNEGTIEARDEITINIVNPRWEEVDISALTGGDNYYINDVFLLNDHTGWISGGNANGDKFLLKTTDKGATWQLVNNALLIEKIAFYDENTGVAIEDYGNSVYKTFDGGVTYTLVTDPATGASLFGSAMDVSFSQTAGEYQVTAKDINDLKKVFRVHLNDNTIIQYTDVMPNSNMLLYEMKYDGSNGLIYGMVEPSTDLQYIQFSTDNGHSWQGIAIPAPSDWMGGNNNFEVQGGDIAGNKIWLCGGDNSDYLDAFSAVSNDGGNTWQILGEEEKLAFDTEAFLDVAIAGNDAYTVNYAAQYYPAMYYSNDDGANWRPLYEITTNNEDQHVTVIDFKGNDFGIATGERILYRYIGN